MAREQFEPEYKKMNPNAKIPTITLEEGKSKFVLFESHAILRYLCNKYQVDDHWYPQEAEARAKIDEYLDWHHSNLREGAEGLFLHKYIVSLLGITPKQEVIKAKEKIFKKSLQIIENYWL